MRGGIVSWERYLTDGSSGGEPYYDLKGMTRFTSLAGIRGVTSLAISPDGKHVYVSGSLDNAVMCFTRDMARGGKLTNGVTIRGGDLSDSDERDGYSNGRLSGVAGMAVSHDGRTVYAAARYVYMCSDNLCESIQVFVLVLPLCCCSCTFSPLFFHF